jgi:hypothetical protein
MTAHNWTTDDTNGFALDGGWVPADNGRNATPATDATNADMSQTCWDCHIDIYNGGGAAEPTYSPTLNDGIAGETEFQQHGYGTHFMGDTLIAIGGMAAALSPSNVEVYTLGEPWIVGIQGATGTGWSRYKTGATVFIVCESCHELEPDKNNAAGGHLLLANYIEGQNGNNGDADGADDFCQACHKPAGTHPLTGETVDRTNAALSTGPAGWLVAPTNGPTMAADDLSCDSCHQPHDANTNSANFILDFPDAGSGAGTIGVEPTPANIVGPNAANWAPQIVDGEDGGAHNAFCQECHNY